MAYATLGSRQVSAALDTTGMNPGNWTITCGPAQMTIQVPQFECYHIYLANVLSGMNASVALGARYWGFTAPNQGSEWDPNQPMLIQPGQSIYLFFNYPAATGTAPTATFWFRYDVTQWGAS